MYESKNIEPTMAVIKIQQQRLYLHQRYNILNKHNDTICYTIYYTSIMIQYFIQYIIQA